MNLACVPETGFDTVHGEDTESGMRMCVHYNTIHIFCVCVQEMYARNRESRRTIDPALYAKNTVCMYVGEKKLKF